MTGIHQGALLRPAPARLEPSLLRPYRHCENHRLPTWHLLPDWQHVGPLNSRPPHWANLTAHVELAGVVAVGVARVVVVLTRVVAAAAVGPLAAAPFQTAGPGKEKGLTPP